MMIPDLLDDAAKWLVVDHADRRYLVSLRPQRDKLLWWRQRWCGPSSESCTDGCRMVTRWVAMLSKLELPSYSICPICWRRIDHAWWRGPILDHGFVPTRAQERNVRALYAGLRDIAAGRLPRAQADVARRMRLHASPAKVSYGHRI